MPLELPKINLKLLKNYSQVLRKGFSLSSFPLVTRVQVPSSAWRRVKIYSSGQRRVRVEVDFRPDRSIEKVRTVDPDRMIVITRDPEAYRDKFGEFALQYGKQIIVLELGGNLSQFADDADPVRVVKKFLKDIHLKFDDVEADPYFVAAGDEEDDPDEPFLDNQWALRDDEGIKWAEADEIAKGGQKDVIVALVDGPIMRDHGAFSHAVEAGRLLNTITVDKSGGSHSEFHATTCGGVLLAREPDVITGVAYNCSMLPVDVSGPNSKDGVANSTSRLIEGLKRASENGARIMSVSLECDPPAGGLNTLIGEHKDDWIVVAAAGNWGTSGEGRKLEDDPVYPASAGRPNVITVIGSDEGGELATGSNVSKTIAHIAAPGSSVASCQAVPDEPYGMSSGTSMAAPHVAGVCALIMSVAPKASVAQVKRWILDSASRRAGLNGYCSKGGILNAHEAVKRAKAWHDNNQ
jgi:subtilisin family serine protease